ncbi:MAG: glutamyl-tRNA reductase, partial [Myxococcota bacterium]|nr:glutamyl-tRNA reductase [Myxococcota bacterium]
MAEIFVIGVSHRSSPVALREQLAIAPGTLSASVKALAERAELAEALMISTCNRVEIYGVAADSGGARRAREILAARLPAGALEPHLYER